MIVKTRGKVQEEILQDIRLTGVAKCLFMWSKCSHWNIECGDLEYVHCFTHKHLIGCSTFSWREHQWTCYSAHHQYQKKLTKVTKMTEIITSAIAVFESSLSKALNNGGIDEREFHVLQDLLLKVINELTNINRKMELETEINYKKVCWKR